MNGNCLHVLHVTGTMNRGGAEVMLMDIFRNISPDVRFDFLINAKKSDPTPRGDFDEEIIRRGGRLLYIGTQWELGLTKYIARFKEIVKEIGKPDVVHIHLNARCGVIALAARLCGVRKVIAHSHADLKFRGAPLSRFVSISELQLQRVLIALFATDFWGCSPAANRSLFPRLLLCGREPIVLNNAVDVATFQEVPEAVTRDLRQSYGAGPDSIVLGNVGRVVRHKKVDFVIDVLKELDRRGVDFLFVFAGREDDGPYMQEIWEKAKSAGVDDRVVHLGDRGDVPAVMSTFDIFVGPALKEGFGLVAAEAQASGVPCVLSRGFPETVNMGLGIVTYVNNYNPENWADAILESKYRKCTDKRKILDIISARGFDALENANRIQAFYRS